MFIYLSNYISTLQVILFSFMLRSTMNQFCFVKHFVNFHFLSVIFSLPVTPYGPYWVLETNYTDYSIVYSCTNVLHLFHFDFAWILARSPSLPAETVQHAKQLLTDEGIDISEMTPTYQNCKDA